MSLKDTNSKVLIHNSDTGVPTEFWVVLPRWESFCFSFWDRQVDAAIPVAESWGGDGVDSSAVMGMTLLFESIPQKFPVRDLLNWIHTGVTHDTSRESPDYPVSFTETVLGKWAKESMAKSLQEKWDEKPFEKGTND